DLRSHSMAASRSPLFSTSAFLHSIMPAPDRSRSSFTIWAEILLIGSSPMLGWRDGKQTPSRVDLGSLAAVGDRRLGAYLAGAPSLRGPRPPSRRGADLRGAASRRGRSTLATGLPSSSSSTKSLPSPWAAAGAAAL